MSIIQSYTIAPVLRYNKKSKKTGLIPVYIRLTVDRKTTYQTTAYKLRTDQWNEKDSVVKNHPNSTLINAALRSYCSEVEKEILGQHIKGNVITRRILKAKPSSTPFSKFAKEIKGDTRATRKECTRVENFHGSDPWLTEFNHEFLRKFQDHELKRGIDPNTVHTTFKFFRRIFRVAHEEGLIDKNPLKGFLFPKYVKPAAVFLDDRETALVIKGLKEKIAPAKDASPYSFRIYAVTVYFLVACYSGLRNSDWGKAQNFTIFNNNWILRAHKNDADLTLPVGNTLRWLLELTKELPPPPSLEICNQILKVVGPMCGLKKTLTTHVGRHTFGCLLGSLKFQTRVIAEIMGISEKTAAIYTHMSGTAMEEEMQKLRAV